ncbi:condensation domain-containing protein [Micromonospora echinofusca]|uniref:Condensation domain-containing protein n=1 Tax=Micromonospora echinofusca TaxID=47858 RepID=A0ABS3VQF0_MICEH|nr:condensation domain-containing protein [Micromonospora echinofusca]MBO4206762.1 hypothetical protein [Micromonospora echinofusca]
MSVPFDAGGAGADRSAPLTWGQHAIWTALRRHGPGQTMISIRRVVPVPRRAAADPARVLRAVADLVVRHDSLRTRLRTVDGQHRQAVSGAGELPVHLVRTTDGDDVAAATEVAERLAATPFDHAEEWPQRFALVLAGDQVRQVVVVFSHTTVDFRAAEIVLRDLRMLLLRGTVGTPAGLQSVDVALREGDEYHRRRAERAVTHWVDGYARLPVDTVAEAGPPREPRFQRAVLTSAAADTATRLIAARHQVTSSTVLLAATAAVVARWTERSTGGNGTVGVYTMSNNRSPDGYADAIAKLNQLGLVVVDVADRPCFHDLLPRVWQAAFAAYRHAYYDPDRIAEAYARAGFPYATGISPHCYLNDIRLATDVDLFRHATDEGAVRRAMAATTLTRTGGFTRFTWRTRVEILDAPGGLGLALTADTAHLPPEAIGRFLRDLERLLVEAAFGEVPWPWL